MESLVPTQKLTSFQCVEDHLEATVCISFGKIMLRHTRKLDFSLMSSRSLCHRIAMTTQTISTTDPVGTGSVCSFSVGKNRGTFIQHHIKALSIHSSLLPFYTCSSRKMEEMPQCRPQSPFFKEKLVKFQNEIPSHSTRYASSHLPETSLYTRKGP